MSFAKHWLLHRKSLVEAIRKLGSEKEETNWQPILCYIEEKLKEDDVETTQIIYKNVVQLCESPESFITGLKLFDKLLPCSRLLREWVFEPLEPCLIRLVESNSAQVCSFLLAWDECYGSQFPSLRSFVCRFVKKMKSTSIEMKCTNSNNICEEEVKCVMKQLRECLGLIVPSVVVVNSGDGEKEAEATTRNGEQYSSDLTKDVTIQLVTDISLLENEENKIVFDSCRELLGQLEKIYDRMKQMNERKEDCIIEVDSILQHCYRLGLRKDTRSLYSYDRTSEESNDDIVWETVVDDMNTEENVEEKCSESNNYSTSSANGNETQVQQVDCNEDILAKLETAMPYPKRKERRNSFVSKSSNQNTLQRRKKKETSKHRIAKQLKQSASKVSKTWNQMQEREDLERYHQTFANSVTVGRID